MKEGISYLLFVEQRRFPKFLMNMEKKKKKSVNEKVSKRRPFLTPLPPPRDASQPAFKCQIGNFRDLKISEFENLKFPKFENENVL